MPRMDGFEFLEKYKEQHLNRLSQTRLFLLTCLLLKSDKEKLMDQDNVEEVIEKPLTRKILTRLFQKNPNYNLK